ncbi:MAG: recombinase family protein [Lachnospiraceae bacterium]|nr:recombinase family protein [Lachnospiraceae bacterium]
MIIGIYPRKSVYRDNSDSVAVQIELCKEYAAIIFKGQEIVFRVYDRDEGFSGKNTKRPSFQELMRDVKKNELDVVMVYKLDRISRNVREFSAMYETFEEHGVAFVSVKESFDTSTPIGRTVMYILAAFAQLERENTSERVTDNMLALAEQGRWTGGNCPAGMKSVRKKTGDKEHSFLDVDKDSIWRVKLLYKLLLNGYTITGLERYCKSHGIKSQGGAFLNSSQIYTIVTNPVYCQNSLEAYSYFQELGCKLAPMELFDGSHGCIRYGRTKTGREKQTAQTHEHWTIAVGLHDYVVSASDFIAAQKRLGINKTFRSGKHPAGILKGVLTCKCGAKMTARTYVKNGIQFSYYYCDKRVRQGKEYCDSKYVRVDIIDELFLKQLRNIRINPDFIKIQIMDTNEADVDTMYAELNAINIQLGNLAKALSENSSSSAAKYIIAQMEELDKQQAALKASTAKAELMAENKKTAVNNRQLVYENVCYLVDNLEQLSYSEKNELVRRTVKSCSLQGKNLSIIF